MKEYFISADIHSYFKEYQKALLDAGFDENNPEHIIIICGDLFDRGKESREMLAFVKKMLAADRAFLIRGNHEDLLCNIFKRGYIDYIDYSNGTYKTMSDLIKHSIHDDDLYEAKDKLRKTGLFDVFNQMKDYLELGNYIFVHGWIPSIELNRGQNIYDPDWRNATIGEWNNARWDNGMQMAFMGVVEPGKTIVCGHWHCSYGNVRKEYPLLSNEEYKDLEFSDNKYFKPYYGDGIIALDACTAFTKTVNVLKLTEEELYKN